MPDLVISILILLGALDWDCGFCTLSLGVSYAWFSISLFFLHTNVLSFVRFHPYTILRGVSMGGFVFWGSCLINNLLST